MKSIQITPYQGIDGVDFGSRPDSIIKLLGKPEYTQKGEFGRTLGYENFKLMFSDKNELEEIGFYPKDFVLKMGETVLIDGDRDLRPHITLKKKDDNPIETSTGALLFLKLGISMTGYHTNNRADRAITCFKKGLWDGLF